jgi:hypothetical protein
MHWLTLVFSEPIEEMLFRRNKTSKQDGASKTLRLFVFSIGLSCFVGMWAAAALRGPSVIHALWTPWTIGVLTMTVWEYCDADSDTMENYKSNHFFICPSHVRQPTAAACTYLVSFAQALLHGLEPLADFEHAVWCVAGLLQLLSPFILAYPPQSKMRVYLVNFVGYSVLALGGYFGDRLRASCIGGLLLGASFTLGIALERVMQLRFQHSLASKRKPTPSLQTIEREPAQALPPEREPAAYAQHTGMGLGHAVLLAIMLLVHAVPLVVIAMANGLLEVPYWLREMLGDGAGDGANHTAAGDAHVKEPSERELQSWPSLIFLLLAIGTLSVGAVHLLRDSCMGCKASHDFHQ